MGIEIRSWLPPFRKQKNIIWELNEEFVRLTEFELEKAVQYELAQKHNLTLPPEDLYKIVNGLMNDRKGYTVYPNTSREFLEGVNGDKK